MLKNVSDNTLPVKAILDVLNKYLPGIAGTSGKEIASAASGLNTEDIANRTAEVTAALINNRSLFDGSSSNVSQSFVKFVNQLADIAKS